MVVVWVLAVVVGVAVVGYGLRTALSAADRRTAGTGYALFGTGVAGYALGRLLGQDWTVVTWLCLAGPVAAWWGTQPGRPGAAGRGDDSPGS